MMDSLEILRCYGSGRVGEIDLSNPKFTFTGWNLQLLICFQERNLSACEPEEGEKTWSSNPGRDLVKEGQQVPLPFIQ